MPHADTLRNRHQKKNETADEPKGHKDQQTEPSNSYKTFIIELTKPARRYLFFSFVTMVLSSTVNISIPRYVGIFVDNIVSSSTEKSGLVESNLKISSIISRSAIFVLLGAFTALASFARTFATYTASDLISLELRKKLFEKVSAQRLEFFDTINTSDIVARIMRDSATLQYSLSSYGESICRHLIEAFGCIILLLSISTRLTLVTLSIVPPIALVFNWHAKKTTEIDKIVQKSDNKATQLALETVRCIRVVRAANCEEKQMNRFNQALQKLFLDQRSLIFANSISVGGLILAASFAISVLVSYGGMLVITGFIESTGTLASFVVYTLYFFYSLSQLSENYSNFYSGIENGRLIFNMIQNDVQEKASTEHLAFDISSGQVDLKNVSFQYPARPDKHALRDLTIKFQANKINALIGESGAGKSSIFNLILGLYEPTSGQILIDGKDLQSLDIKTVRSHIALVSQDPIIFAGTIGENISYFTENATSQDIKNAAIQANVDIFVSRLEKGYDTFIGEHGTTLSGGEKQRIAIARAILQKPKILLLDEATSSLDPKNEELVQSALEKLMTGRTVITIAHRMSTIKNASVIYVMSQGQLLKSGTAKELDIPVTAL